MLSRINKALVAKRIKTNREILARVPENVEFCKEVYGQLNLAISLSPLDKKLRKKRVRVIQALDFYERMIIKAREYIDKNDV
jgi:hypothetical protein